MFGSEIPTTISLSAILGANIKQATYYTDGTNEFLYTVDGNGKTLKRIDLTNGTVTTNAYATTGSGYWGVAASQMGNLYVSEGNRISEFAFNSAVSTPPIVIAGNLPATVGFADGDGAVATFNSPTHLAFSSNGGNPVLYVFDSRNSAIRAVSLGGTTPVSTLVGRWNGTSSVAAPYYTSALLGTMPGLLEPDTDAATKALVGGLTLGALSNSGLAGSPTTGDLLVVSCDAVMMVVAPANK